MPEIRMATVADAELIAGQRYHMFLDAGHTVVAELPEMQTNFAAWVRPRLEDGSYIGWLAVADGAVVGGAGMWLMDFPPHFLDPEPLRAYLLNFYVAPAFRGKGLAGRLLELTLEEAKRRKIQVVSLHASKFGRPIYERYGFQQSSEMMLQLSSSPASR